MTSTVRGSDNFDSGIGISHTWVNFNGTGTVAIRDSENVTSITDNGVGDFTINFTTTLANADYIMLTGPTKESAFGSTPITGHRDGDTKTTAALQIHVESHTGTNYDQTHNFIAIVGGK